MKIATIFLCLFFLISSNTFGQKLESLDSNFVIFESTEIKSLFETYSNLHDQKINVFKIQLFHHENRNYTWKKKTEYEKLYPNKKIDFFYDPPYFKVTTEYFTTKISAQQKMDSIKTMFPNCFIIKQSIPLKEF